MASKRRGNGEGSIFQRSDGLWVAKVTNGYDGSGKRKRKSVYGKTKREVQDKLLDLQQRQKLGQLSDAKSVPLSQYLPRWLKDSARVKVRPTTLQRYTELVDLHIVPAIGGIRLNKLQASDVQDFYNELEESGLSPRTRQFTHSVLSSALRQACKWSLVTQNACELVDAPKVTRTEFTVLTPEQSRLFLREAEGDRLYALYVLALTTGMRQGELFGLKWSDIDLDAGVLSVNRSAIVVNNRVRLGDTKTASSRRRIELSDKAVDALWKHKAKMLAEGLASCDVVFCDTVGGLLRCQNVSRRSFHPLLKQAGLPRIRFHDLRHTAATLLLSEEVHPKIVQERLGHAKISTTLDTYSHVTPTMQKTAAEKLNQVFA